MHQQVGLLMAWQASCESCGGWDPLSLPTTSVQSTAPTTEYTGLNRGGGINSDTQK
jgi:hypothetical protein